jgi:hypothetical protein
MGRRSGAARRAKRAARETEVADADLGRRRPLQAETVPESRSWWALYADHAPGPAAHVVRRERAPVDTFPEWQGRPRSGPAPSADTPDERPTPQQFDARHGIRAARKVKRSQQWWDRKTAGSRALTAAQIRGEDIQF